MVEDKWDIERGIQIVGGDKEIFRMILQTYLEECSIRLDELLAMPNRLEDEFAASAHAFRGSSATIGADYIAELAVDIEKASRYGDLKYVNEQLPILESKMRLLFGKIREYCDGEN